MAVLVTDGFDRYTAVADVLRYWTNNTTMSSLVAGRFGGQALRGNNTGGGTGIQFMLSATYTTLVVGFAYRTASLSAQCNVMSFRDGTGSIQVGMSVSTSGHIQVWRGSIGNLLGTGTATLAINTWYYIEVKVTIDPTAGAVTVNLNGSPELTLTSQNTRNTANTSTNCVGLDVGASSTDFDDLYILDTTGSAPNNDILGPCQIQWLTPDADTAQKNFTPDSGTTNYTRVNETTNDLTSYVSGTAVGKDIYSLTDLTVTPTNVYAVKSSVLAQKTEPGPRTVRGITKTGNIINTGSTRGINTDAVYLDDIYNTNPNTGVAWTAGDVNQMSVGEEIIT